MTGPSARIDFGPFRLDLATKCLWRDGTLVPLPPRAVAVLCELAQRAGALVTKDTLLAVAWPDAAVSDWSLSRAVYQLRAALGDSATTPTYIETVHGHGFRFNYTSPAPHAGPLMSREQDVSADDRPAPDIPHPTRAHPVGRQAELRVLRERLAYAAAGERQVVFVTGEAGIGKTTLLDRFLADAPSAAGGRAVWVLHGQCVEQQYEHEPYLALLDGLARFAGGADRTRLVPVLQQYAPSWLSQMPWLLDDTQLAQLRRSLQGSGPQRMLREFATAVEHVAGDGVLVLVLEDLQWSDVATLDLLAFLANRREPARVLVLATYRKPGGPAAQHLARLKENLVLRRRGSEVRLGRLSEDSVGQYLVNRFGGAGAPTTLVASLHRRTGGSPVFLVELFDHLLREGYLTPVAGGGCSLTVPVTEMDASMPDTLRELIDGELDELTGEQAAWQQTASADVRPTAHRTHPDRAGKSSRGRTRIRGCNH